MLQGKQQKSTTIRKVWVWCQEVDLNSLEGQLSAPRGGPQTFSRPRIQVWLIRLSTSILLWTCLIQLLALCQLWHPHLRGWPPCLDQGDFHVHASAVSDAVNLSSHKSFHVGKFPLPLPRKYKNNGYLLVSCNGGLNQMRAAICDMVAIARHLNLTMVIPDLDKTSFWADPSEFQDIFDVKHFIMSLRDEVRIVKEVPSKYQRRLRQGKVLSMPPVSWSDDSYYINQILPLLKKNKILHFYKTDTRLANSGLPLDMQKLRCRVNYEALQFIPQLEELGTRLVRILQANGPFLVLHLRYEMDMLAFSGCTHGCLETETEKLTQLRYAYPWWKEKIIDSEQKRLDGLCPLTPEEIALVLRALGYSKETQIYIAAGEIYGGHRRMASLHVAYPNIVRKEMLLSPKDLQPFQNHSSQMAALDYLVALQSDTFIPTYDGNMARVVEGHRRYLGFRKTVLLDRKRLIELLDQYDNGTLRWDDFALAVKEAHKDRLGMPTARRVIPEKPKEEDYFYANPQECLP
eukprot:c28616_g1_i1 orf=1310-2860(+)